MPKEYQEEIESLTKCLETNTKTGLSREQVEKRLKEYGPNKIKEEKATSPLTIFFRQFLSPLMYILFVAAIASIFIGHTNDAIVIGIAVAINVFIGFFQEWKAERAALSLKSYEVPHCQVLRNGEIISIETILLVPGDIVLLVAGSRVPADIRLFHAIDLAIEEAILTGESHAIQKNTRIITKDSVIGDRENMAFSGTYVISGKGEGIVVATGEKTELGKIAKLILKIKEEQTPLQKQIQRFSWFLGWLMLGITAGVLLLGVIKGFDFKEILITSIALAVAAIPEGLLIAVTVVLAIGMQRMLKRKALVRHLIAAETLGSVTVICTDKTGTLTKGHMAVDRIATPNQDTFFSASKELQTDALELLKAASLNNDAHIEKETGKRIGNSTEVALLQAAQLAEIDTNALAKSLPRIDEIPFSSDLKYMATVHNLDGKQRLIVKGAPEKLFPMISFDQETREWFKQKSHELTQSGLRVLALAQKDSESIDVHTEIHGLTILGLVGLQDPLRPEAAETIKELSEAGIRTVVVTGDHKDTAKKIAEGAGITIREGGCVTGVQLDVMSDDVLYDRIRSIDLFARVDPKHKIRIVDAWQKQGNCVAMIGDGVNDAPALKVADIGVALGSGSDVAHEISDMVLLDNNLSTISAAVRQGRIIFDNIRKIIVYLMADSFSEIILIAGSMLLGLPLPILATQILWINLVTDGFPDIALTMEPGEPEIMREKPRPKDEPVMNTEMKALIFIIGVVTDLGLFGLYWGLLRSGFDLPHIRTIIFTALAIDSLLYVFSVRSFRTPLFRMNPFKNKWLNLAVVGGLLVQLAAIYLPSMQRLFSTVSLGKTEWMIILALALVKITGIEITKDWFIKRSK